MSSTTLRMLSCAFCYKKPESSEEGSETAAKQWPRCAKCGARPLCSRECQKDDWKAGHRKWCGVAGEMGIDFDVREVAGKGLGTFALRDFKRGDKIMAERPLLTSPGGIVPDHATSAVSALMPIGGTQAEKFHRNAIATTDTPEGATGGSEEQGLFVNMSRVNHACIANALHGSIRMSGQNIKLLVASVDIPAGDEITFPYNGIGCGAKVCGNRQVIFMKRWNFRCSCLACVDLELGEKLVRAEELDSSIMRLGSNQRFASAIRAGEALLKLYGPLCASPRMYSRTYYDLFQVAVTRKRTLSEAKKYIKAAARESSLFYGGDNDPTVIKFKHLANHPETHRNYLICG